MKFLIMPVLLSAAALGQTPARTITFNRADTEHCKVVAAHGKPLLETTYDGTSVAVAMPVNRGNGEFLIFVAISRTGTGAVEENPKDFYGLYSDSAHTRFTFFDEAAQMAWHAGGHTGDAGVSGADAQLDPGLLRPGQAAGGGPRSGSGTQGGLPDDARSGQAPPAPGGAGEGPPNTAAYFLRRSKVKPGHTIAGWVALRKVKGAKLQVHSTDMLDEIDIPVNSTVFRF